MMSRNIDHMFGGFEYRKPGDEIIAASNRKIEKLKSKITEREKRIKDLRAEHDIDDSDLIQLLKAARKNDGRNTYTYQKMSVSNTRVVDKQGPGLEEKPSAPES